MDELTERMDFILTTIDEDRWIAFTKDDEPILFKAKDKLRAYGLIERHGQLSWQLTLEGYKAVELGGFNQWLSQSQVDKNTGVRIDNVSIISGDSNRVNQSRFDSIKDSKIKQTIIPAANEKRQNAIVSFIEKFWWTMLIPIIVGIIILFIEQKWFK